MARTGSDPQWHEMAFDVPANGVELVWIGMEPDDSASQILTGSLGSGGFGELLQSQIVFVFILCHNRYIKLSTPGNGDFMTAWIALPSAID